MTTLEASLWAGDVPSAVERQAFHGLERLCEPAESIRTAPGLPGIERIEACFQGKAFEPHRHDTYAVGVTRGGVQTFHYRGAAQASLPGQVIVLHPDEKHDGAAGTEAALQYSMVYLEPALLLRGLGAGAGLPFVPQAVFDDSTLRDAVLGMLGPFEEGLESLAVDGFVTHIAEGLARHAGEAAKPLAGIALRQVGLVRDYLAAHCSRAVNSEALEEVAGLDRYTLYRHFRKAFATSPHRFLVMRRLDRARGMIAMGEPLAEVAAATGFADQSHLTRHFKKAFGLTPGRWATLVAGRADIPAGS